MVDGVGVRRGSSVCVEGGLALTYNSSVDYALHCLPALIRLINCHKSVKLLHHVIKICHSCQDLQLCFLYPITSSVRILKQRMIYTGNLSTLGCSGLVSSPIDVRPGFVNTRDPVSRKYSQLPILTKQVTLSRTVNIWCHSCQTSSQSGTIAATQRSSCPLYFHSQ